jgi:predicted metal-dependent HD superfamily phosphohydrolase
MRPMTAAGEIEPGERWCELLTACGATDASAVHCAYQQVAARYREPHRRYHTLRHIMAVLDAVDELEAASPVADLRPVRLAGWLHDVVYDTGASDNEQQSADWARAVLSGLRVPPDLVEECCAAVLATAEHVAHNAAQELLLDADLSVLAGDPDAYDEYAAAVRAEYGRVSNCDFRVGRAAVLSRLLARDRLFCTPGAACWEAPARANIARELAARTT